MAASPEQQNDSRELTLKRLRQDKPYKFNHKDRDEQ